MEDSDHGKIESAGATADSRLQAQLPWLEGLPTDFSTVLDVGSRRRRSRQMVR
jgi:hypothetical protein